MTIKAQEVAFIKTTGEAVMVLSYPNSNNKATVRRPIQGNNGIFHKTEEFNYFELETLDEQRKRYLGEREELMRKYAPKSDESPATPDNGFLPN